GRYDHTDVQTRDRSGLVPALTGTHGYARFNPSAGLTYRLRRGLGTYLSYGESARVPTPVELTCADPPAPCRLPNALLAAPQLAEVVARDVEAGMRGEIEAQFLGRIDWHLGGFNTITSQDILFQTTGGATGNQGFFANVADTTRRGAELGLSGV